MGIMNQFNCIHACSVSGSSFCIFSNKKYIRAYMQFIPGSLAISFASVTMASYQNPGLKVYTFIITGLCSSLSIDFKT